MRPPTSETGFRRNHPDRPYLSTWLIVSICALVAPGCEEETRNVGKRPETRALDQTGISVGLDEIARAQVQAKPPAKQSGPIIGQRTTDIRNAATELKQGGAQVASTKNRRQRPDHCSGKCLRLDCRPVIRPLDQHAMDLYHASNDRYPKDL